jgi:hypothetical protein
MSALPVVLPEIPATKTHRSAGVEDRSCRIAAKQIELPATETPGDWKLTDRGIAFVMLMAAVIMTAAVAVIGITAVRVTSADYDAGSQRSQQARR